MAAVDDIATRMSDLIRNLSALTTAISTVFPQVSSTASTASGGAATLPANPVGFFTVTTPSGTTVKVPYYAS